MPFDLTTEPWIPVRSRDGQRKEVGLRELFARAHELECVDDPSPLVTLALYRLLIAVVLRVDGPASIQEWIHLYKSTQFSDQSFAKYFDRWRERLDLLHPERCEPLERVARERPVQERHHRLGQPFRQRPEPRPEARREDHAAHAR